MLRLNVRDVALGKWHGLLLGFGLTERQLSGKHGPCPVCGGTDRFHFDNKQGRGTWFCSKCGAGDGVALLMSLKGWDFKTAANAGTPVSISHELQLSSYAYLLRMATGRTESELQIRSLVKTKTPSVVTHRYPPREDRHFRRLFAVIREYLDALDRGQFNFRPGWTCGACDYRESVCAAWGG